MGLCAAGLASCRHAAVPGSAQAVRADSLRAHEQGIRAIDEFESVARLVTDSLLRCRPIQGRSCFAGRIVPLAWRPRDLLPRDSLEPGRDRVLAVLDSVLLRIPGDRILEAQRIELLVMGRRFADAEVAVRGCRASPGECAMLRMYVLHNAGRFAEAETALDSALSALPAVKRCLRRSPLTLVLTGEAASRHEDLACADRHAFESRVWWLSDASHLVAGNERRTEHYARLLRHEMLWDWLWGWQRQPSRDRYRRLAVDSMRQMPLENVYPLTTWESFYAFVIARGWYDAWQVLPVLNLTNLRCATAAVDHLEELPYTSSTILYGWFGDPVWFNSLGQARDGSPCIAVWRATPGYQLIPKPAALVDPFHADPAAWQPEGWRREWREEYTPPYGPFATLTEHQIAFFHDTTAGAPAGTPGARLAVVVGGLDENPTVARLQRQHGATARWDVGLVLTDTFPVRVKDVIAARRPPAPLASRYAWQVPASWRPHVVSMEALGPNRIGVARFRAGVSPPAMPDQRITISDLLLFDPDTTLTPAEQPRTLDAILPRALATTTIDPRRPLGLFWETYGLQRADTATVAVTLERERGGFLERLGTSLRLLDAPSGVTVRYALDPGRGDAAPALGHALRIGLGTLDPGRYTLTLRVTTSGQQRVEARRIITVP